MVSHQLPWISLFLSTALDVFYYQKLLINPYLSSTLITWSHVFLQYSFMCMFLINSTCKVHRFNHQAFINRSMFLSNRFLIDSCLSTAFFLLLLVHVSLPGLLKSLLQQTPSLIRPCFFKFIFIGYLWLIRAFHQQPLINLCLSSTAHAMPMLFINNLWQICVLFANSLSWVMLFINSPCYPCFLSVQQPW